jgi:hypothetical protein
MSRGRPSDVPRSVVDSERARQHVEKNDLRRALEASRTHLEFFNRLKELPVKGTAIERTTRDLKGGRTETNPDPTNEFELAKDVAAFANHLGGELLVGANEESGIVGEYDGLSLSFATHLKGRYSQAIEQRCFPRPLFDFDLFPSPDREDKHVLVVYVAPYVGGQLVGVAVFKDEQNDKYQGHSYVFPVRVGTDCTWVRPDQLLMFTDQRIRRTFIQLSLIREGAPMRIRVKQPNLAIDPGKSAEFLRVRADHNAFHVKILAGGAGKDYQDVYAIDQVRSIHTDGETWWVNIDLV